jgi:hypothetical protein
MGITGPGPARPGPGYHSFSLFWAGYLERFLARDLKPVNTKSNLDLSSF